MLPGNALWIELSKPTLSMVNEKFNATVWMNITETSYAWQTKIHFNTTYLNVSGCGYTDGNQSEFLAQHSSISVPPVINYVEGSVLTGESLLGSEEQNPGYGSLVWVEFELITIPEQTNTALNISFSYDIDTFVLNPFLETIPFSTIQNASIVYQTEPTDTTTPTTTTTPLPLPIEMLAIIGFVAVFLVVGVVILKRRRLRESE